MASLWQKHFKIQVVKLFYLQKMSAINFTSNMSSFFSLGASTQREHIASLKKAFEFIAKDEVANFIKHLLFSTKFGNDAFLPVINEDMNSEILQNIKGLINNTGFSTGNGNGSIIFGSFDTSTHTSRNWLNMNHYACNHLQPALE